MFVLFFHLAISYSSRPRRRDLLCEVTPNKPRHCSLLRKLIFASVMTFSMLHYFSLLTFMFCPLECELLEGRLRPCPKALSTHYTSFQNINRCPKVVQLPRGSCSSQHWITQGPPDLGKRYKEPSKSLLLVFVRMPNQGAHCPWTRIPDRGYKRV